jgi:hypothetical protein
MCQAHPKACRAQKHSLYDGAKVSVPYRCWRRCYRSASYSRQTTETTRAGAKSVDQVGNRTPEAAHLQGDRCRIDNGGRPQGTALEPARSSSPPQRLSPQARSIAPARRATSLKVRAMAALEQAVSQLLTPPGRPRSDDRRSVQAPLRSSRPLLLPPSAPVPPVP